jgi:hypothetical protein
VRWQISQRVTGSWVTVTGNRREDELLIWLYDASFGRVISPCASIERAPRGYRMCRCGQPAASPASLCKQHGAAKSKPTIQKQERQANRDAVVQ